MWNWRYFALRVLRLRIRVHSALYRKKISWEKRQKGGIEPATSRVSAWCSTTEASGHMTWGGYNEDYMCIFTKWASTGSRYPERRRVHFCLAIDAHWCVDTMASSLVSVVSYWLYSCVFLLSRSCSISLRIFVASRLRVRFLVVCCLLYHLHHQRSMAPKHSGILCLGSEGVLEDSLLIHRHTAWRQHTA